MIKILNMFLIGKWYRRIELIALIQILTNF